MEREYEAIIRWKTDITDDPVEWGLEPGEDVAAKQLEWLRDKEDRSYFFEGLADVDVEILVHDITTQSTAARIVAALHTRGWIISPNDAEGEALIAKAIEDQT